MQAIIGPPAKRNLNDDRPTFRICWLGSFVFYRGSWPVFLRNPIFFRFFRGVQTPCPPPPPPPSGSAHGLLKKIFIYLGKCIIRLLIWTHEASVQIFNNFRMAISIYFWWFILNNTKKAICCFKQVRSNAQPWKRGQKPRKHFLFLLNGSVSVLLWLSLEASQWDASNDNHYNCFS